MSLARGNTVGVYEVIARIGAGGMGEVYRARDTRLNRDVALKVLPDAFSNDLDRLARFTREAQTLASLNHPNIAHIHGLEVADGVRALVMELVEGEDLSQRIASGALPLVDALPMARQIAEALEAAHERGIIHRDLKPANIKVRPDGVVKVLDFGLAKALAPESARAAPDGSNESTLTSPAMTQAGMILGTASYMAPEQARGRVVDRRADIWAFGAVLYEMLTGRRAFPGADITDTIVSVVSKEPEWAALPADTPASLRRLLARCLKKDPKARLRDIGEARVQIEELLAGAVDEIAASGGLSVAALPKPRRPSRALIWMHAAFTFGLAAASVWFWIGWRHALGSAVKEWRFAAKTSGPQAIFNARFMPDGESIILSQSLSGNAPQLFESRTSVSPRAFGPPSTHLLSISKTGELAVLTGARFLGHRVFAGTLARMKLDGTPRSLAEDVREADWLPDGSDLAVVRDVAGTDQLEFPIGHVVHKTSGYFSDPRVSPDGNRLAFMEHPAKFDDRGWVKVVDRAGTVTTLAGEYGEEEGIAWSADGATVFFATTRIQSVPANGGNAPTPLTSTPGTLYLLDVAPDGRLLVIRDDSRTIVVARGAGQDVERDLSTGSGWGATFSPDRKLVAYTQGGGGPNYLLILRGVDGSPPAQLGPGNAGAFSPDGKWLTANLFATKTCVVYPIGTGTTVSVPMGPLESCLEAGWFPDGHALMLIGNEPGQPIRTYRSTFPGGTPQPLLPHDLVPQGMAGHGGGERTGSCLLARDAAGMWRRFDSTGPTMAVPALGLKDMLLWCDADARFVFVGDETVLPEPVYRVDLMSGERKKIAEIAPADRAGLLSIFVNQYRDTGEYVYWYVRSLSTLYVATAAK